MWTVLYGFLPIEQGLLVMLICLNLLMSLHDIASFLLFTLFVSHAQETRSTPWP